MPDLVQLWQQLQLHLLLSCSLQLWLADVPLSDAGGCDPMLSCADFQEAVQTVLRATSRWAERHAVQSNLSLRETLGSAGRHPAPPALVQLQKALLEPQKHLRGYAIFW